MENNTSAEIRAVVRQQLATERLLGLGFVPLERPAPAGKPVSQPLSGAISAVHRAAALERGALGTSGSGGGEKVQRLRVLDDTQVKSCRKCALCETRTQTVFGQGDVNARLVFVGEAPGFEEDQQGLAFVGRAGQLLTRMIAAMGLAREQVYICNTLKCRPPGNRTPTAEEMLACGPYLREQLDVIRPEVLVALGAPAAKTLLNTAEPIGKLRGRFHRYFFSGVTEVGPSIPLMPTFHPAYLLRSPDEKRKAWDDLKLVMELLGLSIPRGGRE